MTAAQTVKALKGQQEDFEWYPTTPEIIAAIKKDIRAIAKKAGRYSREAVYMDSSYNDGEHEEIVKIGSVLDIGAGDGRLFSALEDQKAHRFCIKEKVGIEKAATHVETLLDRDVFVIGRDFFNVSLIDKQFSIIFTNPPYSIFETWIEKVLTEGNAEYYYFVLPQRWKNNARLGDRMKEKGAVETLGQFEFLDADRQARGVVDLIRIESKREQGALVDSFIKWVDENIGKFETIKEKGDEDEEETTAAYVAEYNSDRIYQLVENYRGDMQNLTDLYKALGKVDFSLLRQMGINKSGVTQKLKNDIQTLKNQYWRTAFSYLTPLSEKLTFKTRGALLSNIDTFKALDFSEDNIYTVILWALKNFNIHTADQLLEVYDTMTQFEGVTAYKSNTHWVNGKWRYGKREELPEKYKLDYRVVARLDIREYNLSWAIKRANTLIHDISTVVRSLGYDADDSNIDFERDGRSRTVCDKDGMVLLAYRCFQNGNVHIKFNQELMLKMNIEVGKLRGWLNSAEDVQEEFDLDMIEAVSYFDSLFLRQEKIPIPSICA